MNQLELMQSISKYFARFSEQIKILNANSEFHINIHAENLLLRILNMVYDLNLRNLNYSASGNYSAIDLLDDSREGGIAFQITSSNSIDKVKDCIRKYFRSGKYSEANSLYIYMLINKQSSYSESAIKKTISTELESLKEKNIIGDTSDMDFSFSSSLNILDKTDLYKKLNAQNDLNKIIKLERYIAQQYGLIEEREDLSNYYRHLKDMYYETVMNDEKGMTLDQIYTEPSFSVIHSAFRDDDERLLNEPRQKFYNADFRYTIHEFIEDLFAGLNPLSFKCSYRLVLILGYPGQGKSSFCKKLINSYILKDKVAQKPIYYFSLRSVRQVREFIYNPLSILYDEACNVTEYNLNRPEFCKSLLVLDGLDELYMREDLKLEEIDRLCIEFVRIMERYPELTVVLTSRYGYIDDEKLTKENILIVHLSRFTLELQLEWLLKYHVYHSETWLSEEKLKAFNSEERYIHIRELLEQPLLLHMIASVKRQIDEHANRARIYNQLFNELIDRKYAKEGQIEILRNIGKEDLRELIREVAFAIFQSGNGYITKKELFKLPATQSFLKLLPEASFRDTIKGVMIAFYFKEIEKVKGDWFDDDRSNYAIEFLHKSLMEYMTAEKVFYFISNLFLEKRSNGKYMIDDSRSALSLLAAVFSRRGLSRELKYHLRQIVDNDSSLNMVELADRLCYSLEELVLTDFLLEYRMGIGDGYPMDNCLRCFHSFWFFVSCLGLKKNYLTTVHLKYRVAEYLRMMSTSETQELSHLDFSFQDFSTSELSGVHFSNCTFEGSLLSECSMEKAIFSSCTFVDVNFDFAYFHNAEFALCKMRNCSFSNCFLTRVEFTNCLIEESDFSQAELRLVDFSEYDLVEGREKTRMVINNCKFQGVQVDEYTFEGIKRFCPNIDKKSFIHLTDDESGEDDKAEVNRKFEDVVPEDYKRIVLL